MPFKLRLLLWYINIFGKNEATLTPQQTRNIHEKERKKFLKLIDFAPIQLPEIRDEQIKIRDGENITVRIYRPNEKQNLPLIVYYHGGGFVTRNIESHDYVCRRLSKMNEAVVVSVNYRLAPEFKFPIPHQDCYDATVWASNNAAELGANADNLIVMGDSAGGNLATVISILARDLNRPKIAKQVLIYPTTDARLNHPSIESCGKGYFLTKELMAWFVNHYKKTEDDILNPLMSPLLTDNLRNLPPAFVFTAEFDPLKDEGEAYAKRLEEAGNKVLFKEYKGMIHGFFNMPKIAKTALTAQEEIAAFLKN